MTAVRVAQRSFAAGELDGRFRGLADNDLYIRGLRKATGCVFSEYGTTYKRHGTERVFSPIVEFQLHSIIVPGEGTKVVLLGSTSAFCYDAATRTEETTLSGSSYTDIWDSDANAFRAAISVPIGNEIWFFHPDHPTMIMTRSAAGNWTVESLLDKSGYTEPLIDPRPLSTTMTFSAGTAGSTDETITAGTPYFRRGDQNSIWFGGKSKPGENAGFIKVDNFVTNTELEGDYMQRFPTDNVADMTTSDWAGPFKQLGTIPVSDLTLSGASFGVGDVVTVTSTGAEFFVTDAGNLLSLDGVSNQFLQILTFTSNTVVQARVIDATLSAGPFTGVHEWWRPEFREYDGNWLFVNDISGTGVITSKDPIFNAGMAVAGTDRDARYSITEEMEARITTFQSVNHCDVAIDSTWAEADLCARSQYSPYMSDYHGWAGTAALHQARLVLGGFKRFPKNMCFSRTDRVADFQIGTNDDDGFVLKVNRALGEVAWMVSGEDLLMGTTQEEFAIRGAPITPSVVKADVQTTYGGLRDKSALVGGAALFVTRPGTGLREMAFRFESDRYAAPDMTDLNKIWDAVTSSTNIRRQPCFLRNPDPIVLSINDEKELVALSYRPENGVVGWSKWLMSDDPLEVIDKVLSVCAVPVDEIDEAWIITQRVADSVPIYNLEVYTPDAVLDCEETITGISDTSAIAVPASYGDRTVDVMIKGGVYVGSFVVSKTNILDINAKQPSATEVTIGFNIPFEIQPQVIEFDQRDGASDARTRRVANCKMKLNKSFGCEIGSVKATDSGGDDVEEFEKIFPEQEDNVSLLSESFSGVKDLSVPLLGEEPTPTIRGNGPWKFELLAISVSVDIGD